MEKMRLTIDELNHILRSYLPFVVIGSIWVIFPDLVNAIADVEKEAANKCTTVQSNREQPPGSLAVTQ